jgi:hypothetical protein
MLHLFKTYKINFDYFKYIKKLLSYLKNIIQFILNNFFIKSLI